MKLVECASVSECEGEERVACIHRGRARQYNIFSKAEVLATTPKMADGRDKVSRRSH